MKQTILALLMFAVVLSMGAQAPVTIKTVPTVSERWKPGYFPIDHRDGSSVYRVFNFIN